MREKPGARRRFTPFGARTRRLALAAGATVLCLALVLVVLSVRPDPVPRPASESREVVAALPFWNFEDGTSALMSHTEAFTEVSPWMYGLDPAGRVVSQIPSDRAGRTRAAMNSLRGTELRFTPSIANMTHGAWSYDSVAPLLHDPERRKRHVREIVDLVLSNDYAGIDIDYEELRAEDREEFTALVRELADALHAHDRTLSVALFAKASERGYDERNAAQDYAAIGRAADQVRLMGYDRHWSTSPPGPVAPVDWIRDVLAYARGTIPPDKIVLGVPLYGYDWSEGKGQPVTWGEATRIAQRHDVRVRFDEDSRSPWFAYTDSDGTRHEVWFENAASSRAKFEVADRAGIGGVYLWMYGPADPATWPRLRESFPVARRSGRRRG
ncbi:Glycosyl hydrolases family 18 [Actinopolyspora xinjiangensis]|uniref:Glycosyl hydrolases family 18 n=1 Tax=Actinopolyspora xinjiangensis TaxID=405564 RepID=A0A1H0WVF5_9ACTN|nr:glycosyl hydrolase family 18 protein [Actinopolyspora xinjiangensis]SDP94425.1 Glycosyl hydrolases family 18 [Actinopolyspora xinjiangensis]